MKNIVTRSLLVAGLLVIAAGTGWAFGIPNSIEKAADKGIKESSKKDITIQVSRIGSEFRKGCVDRVKYRVQSMNCVSNDSVNVDWSSANLNSSKGTIGAKTVTITARYIGSECGKGDVISRAKSAANGYHIPCTVN